METKTIQDVLLQGFEAKDTAFINWETITKKGNTALKEAERKKRQSEKMAMKQRKSCGNLQTKIPAKNHAKK